MQKNRMPPYLRHLQRLRLPLLNTQSRLPLERVYPANPLIIKQNNLQRNIPTIGNRTRMRVLRPDKSRHLDPAAKCPSHSQLSHGSSLFPYAKALNSITPCYRHQRGYRGRGLYLLNTLRQTHLYAYSKKNITAQ